MIVLEIRNSMPCVLQMFDGAYRWDSAGDGERKVQRAVASCSHSRARTNSHASRTPKASQSQRWQAAQHSDAPCTTTSMTKFTTTIFRH